MNLQNLPLVNLQLGGMSVELTMLALAMVLGFIQLMIQGQTATAERGVAWNAGPRDETAPLKGKLAGRAERAFWNFIETFPFFAAAVLTAAVLERHSTLTLCGAQLYFWGRVVYVPVYLFGIPVVRSLIWLVSAAGIVMLLIALVSPGA